jgi:hypothetical protein
MTAFDCTNVPDAAAAAIAAEAAAAFRKRRTNNALRTLGQEQGTVGLKSLLMLLTRS